MHSSTRQALACIFSIVSVAMLANAQTTPVKDQGGTITGKVTIKGEGVPGIIVAVRQSERLRSAREYSGPKGVTDDDGNYRITNVPPGSYRVMPVAKAYVPADQIESKLIIVNKGDTIEHIDFALVRGAVITGKVVDDEGNPVVEEWVSVLATSDNKSIYAASNASTDDRGVYRFYGLRPGSYRVAAGRDDSFSGVARPYARTFHPSVSDPLQATVIEVREGEEVRDVDITFSRKASTYTARGRIVDGETGQPFANIDYGITRIEGNGGSSSRSGGYRTNGRGEFTIYNLSPGKYTIPVFANAESDLRFEEQPFEIVDQDVNGLVIKSTRAGSISGVVVFEGLDEKTRDQLEHSWVMGMIEGANGQAKWFSGRIARDGSFHLRGLAGGTITLTIHANRPIRIARVERDGVALPSRLVMQDREHVKGLRLITEIANASLRGRIEVANGTLPDDARFYLGARMVGEDLGIRFSGVNLRPQVDARGQFIVEEMMAGTYEVTATVFLPSAKLNYIAKKQVVITPGSTTTVNITVDLSSTPLKQ